MGNELLGSVDQATIDKTAATLDVAEKRKLQRMRPIQPLHIPQRTVGSSLPSIIDTQILGPADVGAYIVGSPDLRVDGGAYHLEPMQPARPINVIFTPSHPGEFNAKITLSAAWKDGHFEEQHTWVTASARSKDEPPDDAIVQPVAEAHSTADRAIPNSLESGPQLDQSRASAPVTQAGLAETATDFGVVKNAVVLLFDKRQLGVRSVQTSETEDKLNHPPDTSMSIWWDLAGLAISLGTGGLGGVLGLAIESAAKAKVGEYVAKYAGACAEQLLGKAVGASVQALQQAGAGSNAPTGTAAFFSKQDDALVDAKSEMSDAADKQLGKRVRGIGLDAKGLGIVAQATHDAIHALAGDALAKQAQATALKYIDYCARADLGTAMPRTLDAPRASYMAEAREVVTTGGGQGQPSHDYKGLVELEVEDQGGAAALTFRYAVKRARVHGVPQDIANSLVATDLRRAGVPIRILVRGLDGNQGIITRDEAGTVRYNWGDRRVPDGAQVGDPEAQSIRSAEGIVNVTLSKSLAAWGVGVDVDKK